MKNYIQKGALTIAGLISALTTVYIQANDASSNMVIPLSLWVVNATDSFFDTNNNLLTPNNRLEKRNIKISFTDNTHNEIAYLNNIVQVTTPEHTIESILAISKQDPTQTIAIPPTAYNVASNRQKTACKLTIFYKKHNDSFVLATRLQPLNNPIEIWAEWQNVPDIVPSTKESTTAAVTPEQSWREYLLSYISSPYYRAKNWLNQKYNAAKTGVAGYAERTRAAASSYATNAKNYIGTSRLNPKNWSMPSWKSWRSSNQGEK